MEGPSSSRKRPPVFNDEDDSSKPKKKRIRFPKGKKVKAPTEPLHTKGDEEEAVPQDFSNPRFASKERARRRSQMTTQLFTEDRDDLDLSNISSVEVCYQEIGTFVDDGVQMEPFNLEREREEGFFDEAGNYVEYVPEKEEKDAWLDNVEFDPKLAEIVSTITKNENEEQDRDLSSADIAKMKRRIADVLMPAETVLQALKRLKGNPTDKKAKMSAETKAIFDQLTEDAMRLMENGDYNVYHEEREVFEREAEGYEALVRARNNDLSGNEGGEFDMFADEDDVAANTEQNDQTFVASEGTGSQLPAGTEAEDSGTWTGQNDYVYDEASGYYYSSSLGYYYDPATGLFCSAASGQWYRYNEDAGTYDEVQPEEAEAESELHDGTDDDEVQPQPEASSTLS